MLEVIFLTAFGLALLMCCTPGALNTEALRRGVEGGFRRALMIEVGSCIGDLAWAALALIGLAFLMENDVLRVGLGVAGALLLLYLAYDGLKAAKTNEPPRPLKDGGRSDFMTGALISLGNPFELAFWVGIGGSVITVIAPEPSAMVYIVFFVGYTIGLLIFSFAYSGLIAYGRKFIDQRLFRAINVLCALVLIYFALSLLWSTFAG